MTVGDVCRLQLFFWRVRPNVVTRTKGNLLFTFPPLPSTRLIYSIVGFAAGIGVLSCVNVAVQLAFAGVSVDFYGSILSLVLIFIAVASLCGATIALGSLQIELDGVVLAYTIRTHYYVRPARSLVSSLGPHSFNCVCRLIDCCGSSARYG